MADKKDSELPVKSSVVDADKMPLLDSETLIDAEKNKTVQISTLRDEFKSQTTFSGGGNAVTDAGTEQTVLDDILISALDSSKLVRFEIQTTVTGANPARYDIKLYTSSTVGGTYIEWAHLKSQFNGFGTVYDSGNMTSIQANASQQYWRMTIQRIGGTANNIPAGCNFIATVY